MVKIESVTDKDLAAVLNATGRHYRKLLEELLANPSQAKVLRFPETPQGMKQAEHAMRALQYLRTRDWAKHRYTTHTPAFRRVGNRVYVFIVDLKDAPLHWGGQAPEDVRKAAIQRRLTIESNTQS